MSNPTSGGRTESPVVQLQAQQQERLHGLLDAISELQMYHTTEMNGGHIPEGFYTTKHSWKLIEIGFRTTFLSGLVSALLTPLAIGVIEKMVPVFGSAEPTPFDNLFVICLSLSYLICYGVFLGKAARSFYGAFTHGMVKDLLSGIFAAAILKLGIIVILFNWIYVSVLTQRNLVKVLAFLTKWIKVENLEGTYGWLMEFRPVLLTSAYFVAVTTALFLAIIAGCYFSALHRNRKIREAGF